jgi:hypothetical protein
MCCGVAIDAMTGRVAVVGVVCLYYLPVPLGAASLEERFWTRYHRQARFLLHRSIWFGRTCRTSAKIQHLRLVRISSYLESGICLEILRLTGNGEDYLT